MFDKVVINFTPTGMIPTNKMTPHVPVSVSEVVEYVHQATELGISTPGMRKLGSQRHNKEVYGEIIAGIRKYAPELVKCVSLSGRNVTELEYRPDPDNLNGNLEPDMGS